MQWRNEYFISFPHTIYWGYEEAGCKRVYRPHLAIISMRAPFDLIYASGPLDFGNVPFLEPVGRLQSGEEINICTNGHILTPGNIAHIDREADQILMTMSVNDETTILAEVVGASRVIEKAIETYERGDVLIEEVVSLAETKAREYCESRLPAYVRDWEPQPSEETKSADQDEEGVDAEDQNEEDVTEEENVTEEDEEDAIAADDDETETDTDVANDGLFEFGDDFD